MGVDVTGDEALDRANELPVEPVLEYSFKDRSFKDDVVFSLGGVERRWIW